MVVASHLLLLHKPTYPDPQLKSLLIESYPTLVSYSQKIYDLAFATDTLDLRFASMSISLRELFPTLPKGRNVKKRSAEDVHFERMRWAFFGLVGGAFAAYLAIVTRGLEIKWVEEGDNSTKSEDEERH